MAIEVNDTTKYDVAELRWEMGRASTLRFYPVAGLADSDPIADRSVVVFTSSTGVCLFYGRTLPARRVLRNGEDTIEYVAADPIEWLAHNVLLNDGDGVNEWYNRKDVDVTVFAYPVDQTIQQIIETEFDDIVGGGNEIEALDFTAATNPRAVVPFTFQAKGKSRLGLVDALVAESPGLSYWYDPTTYNEGSSFGTLRFYDVSQAGSPAYTVRLPLRETAGHTTPSPNCESFDLVEDVSASYDTVVVHGWGVMTEVYEAASPAWTGLTTGAIGTDMPFLRKAASGAIEWFDVTDGTWKPEATATPRPWFPESNAPGYKAVGRRFTVPSEIADIKIVRKDGTDPAVYVRETQSMWLDVCQNVFYIGKAWLDPADHRSIYTPELIADIRFHIFGPLATVDNDGDVRPNDTLYPLFPTIRANDTKFPLPNPQNFERTTFVVKDPLIRRTNYVFTLNKSGLPVYDNILNQACFKYWPTYQGLYLRHTKREDLTVTRTDGALGYDRELHLYDQRFLVYIDKDAVTLRDDTDLLDTYVDPVWDLVKRKRYLGSVTVHEEGPVGGSFPRIGCGVTVVNYKTDGATRALPVIVQSVDLTEFESAHRVTLGFDRSNTFLPLSKFLEGKEWYSGTSDYGDGVLEGKRGNRSVVDKKRGRPADQATPPGDSPKQTVLTNSDATPYVIVRGVVTEAYPNESVDGTGNVLPGIGIEDTLDTRCVKYKARTIDGTYVTTAAQVPRIRQFRAGTTVIPAAVGSECLISVAPKEDASGFEAKLYATHEQAQSQFITGTIVAGPVEGGSPTSTSPGLPPATHYSWVSDDGVWKHDGGIPVLRVYTDNAQVVPAPVGSQCVIVVVESPVGNPTASLWMCSEKLDFEGCGGPTAASFSMANFDPTNLVCDADGNGIASWDGNVVLRDADTAVWQAEDEVVVDKNGEIVYDRDGDAVVADQSQTGAIPSGYFDALLVCDKLGNTVFGYDGVLVSAGTPVSVPALGVEASPA